jgi:aryl-alcohol dehydrogenase-like predicted oxidoreductase
MRYNRLGHSGLRVSALCRGALRFGPDKAPWGSGPAAIPNAMNGSDRT